MTLKTVQPHLLATLVLLFVTGSLFAADTGTATRQTTDIDSVTLRWVRPTQIDLTNHVQPLIFSEGGDLLWLLGQQRLDNYTWAIGYIQFSGAGVVLEQLWSTERPGFSEPRAPVWMMGDLYYIRQKATYSENDTVYYQQRLGLMGVEHSIAGSTSFYYPGEGSQIFAEASIVTPDTSIVSTGWVTRNGFTGTYVIRKKMNYELSYHNTYYWETAGGQNRKRYLLNTTDNEVQLVLGPDPDASPANTIDLYQLKVEGVIGWTRQIRETNPFLVLHDVKRFGSSTLLLYQSQSLQTAPGVLKLVELDERGNLVNEVAFELDQTTSLLNATLFLQEFEGEDRFIVAVDILGGDPSRGDHHLDLFALDNQYGSVWSGSYNTSGHHPSMLTMEPGGAILQAWVTPPSDEEPAHLGVRTVQANGAEGRVNWMPLEGIESIKPVLHQQAWTNDGYWVLQGGFVERMNGHHRAWVANLSVARSAAGTTGAVTSESHPLTWSLVQAWPNPFNASTLVRYTLPVAQPVRLRVMDLLGREVAVLAEGPQLSGQHDVQWNATGNPTGIYFIRLEAGKVQQTRKVVLVK